MSSSVLVQEAAQEALQQTAQPAELDLLPPPHPACRAAVIVPARNEQDSLANTLDALRLQTTSDGAILPHPLYEVILLLNNCTDRSAAIAERYALDHPEFYLHIAQCKLAPAYAHVGMARHLLMEAACTRLESLPKAAPVRAILSTDADTVVAPEWIASNLAELEHGAEVVGGIIYLLPEELDALDPGTRLAYLRDRDYQARVARLEALLDPDPADPWPRHLQHFGASLACTPQVYRRSGGLPPVSPLEDIAFIDALRKVNAKIRHAPAVHIFTSARMDGRTQVGLSGQLRHWQRDAALGNPHLVDSAEWLEHRFRTMAALRQWNESKTPQRTAFPQRYHHRITQLRAAQLPTPRFLELLDSDALIEEMFLNQPAPRRAPIEQVIEALDHRIADCAASRL